MSITSAIVNAVAVMRKHGADAPVRVVLSKHDFEILLLENTARPLMTIDGDFGRRRCVTISGIEVAEAS